MLGVIEDGDVTLELAKAEIRWRRALEAWEAITWIVCRDPKAGRALTESGRARAYTLEGAQSIGWPTVTIIYTVTDSHITVVDARFEDARHGQAGRA